MQRSIKSKIDYIKAENGVEMHVHDDESEDSDSDAKQMFQLPKRKVVRPPSAALKKKVGSQNRWLLRCRKCCRMCFATIFPIAIAVFVVAMLLSVGFMMVAMSSMKQELQIMKLRMSNVESADHTSLAKNQEAQVDLEKEIRSVKGQLSAWNHLADQLAELSKQVYFVNVTLVKMKNDVGKARGSRIAAVMRDIESLKNGMADTGSDIEKLKSTNKLLLNDVSSLQSNVHDAKEELFNVTVTVSKLADRPPPHHSTTPKPVIVTLTPTEDTSPYSKKEVDSMFVQLKKDFKSRADTTAAKLNMELYKLKSICDAVNYTHFDDMIAINSELKKLRNRTEQVQVLIRRNNLTARQHLPTEKISTVTPPLRISSSTMQTSSAVMHSANVIQPTEKVHIEDYTMPSSDRAEDIVTTSLLRSPSSPYVSNEPDPSAPSLTSSLTIELLPSQSTQYNMISNKNSIKSSDITLTPEKPGLASESESREDSSTDAHLSDSKSDVATHRPTDVIPTEVTTSPPDNLWLPSNEEAPTLPGSDADHAIPPYIRSSKDNEEAAKFLVRKYLREHNNRDSDDDNDERDDYDSDDDDDDRYDRRNDELDALDRDPLLGR